MNKKESGTLIIRLTDGLLTMSKENIENVYVELEVNGNVQRSLTHQKDQFPFWGDILCFRCYTGDILSYRVYYKKDTLVMKGTQQIQQNIKGDNIKEDINKEDNIKKNNNIINNNK